MVNICYVFFMEIKTKESKPSEPPLERLRTGTLLFKPLLMLNLLNGRFVIPQRGASTCLEREAN